MENFFKSGMEFFFLEAGRGDLFWDLSLQEAQGFFLVAFDFGPFSIISITLNSREPSWVSVIFHGQFSR